MKGSEKQLADSAFFPGRMGGIYSYNVLDSPDYIYSKKIERRIQIFNRKDREKRMRQAQRKLEAARNEAKKQSFRAVPSVSSNNSPDKFQRG